MGRCASQDLHALKSPTTTKTQIGWFGSCGCKLKHLASRRVEAGSGPYTRGGKQGNQMLH
jgi:hypothetical protein